MLSYIVVMFIGLGRAYRLGDILKLSNGEQATKRWDHFYGGSWPLKTPCKDFNLAIVVGPGWMKWLKTGAGKSLYFMQFSCTISFLVKILLVKVPLYSVFLNLNPGKAK